MLQFPNCRPRRLRRNEFLRRLIRENVLSTNDLIYPIFVCDDENDAIEIDSMPGVFRYTLKQLPAVIEKCIQAHIPVVALFPFIHHSFKTPYGCYAIEDNNLIIRSTEIIKEKFSEIGVLADVALDPYTTHGHDGVLDKKGEVDNDSTVEILCQQALKFAQVGVDIIAPSDMMDGRIGAIRQLLEKEQFIHTSIMAYAAKYASAFYGPFREAVGSQQTKNKISKHGYQMDPANVEEALREVMLDIQEGADMVMVKPGMPYLDIIGRIKEQFQFPLFAYQVSGEYAMLKAASQNGWLDHDACMMESLLAFKRAGADGILSYFALEAAHIINHSKN